MTGKIRKILLLILLTAVLCSCSVPSDWTVPEAEAMGGYTLTTDNLDCLVLADGIQKYSRFHSQTDGRTVELYTSITEMIVVHTLDGVTQYYRETFAGQEQGYPNPLKTVFAALEELEFKLEGQRDGANIYKALRTEEIRETNQVSYTVYELEVTWMDGEIYRFRYYDYADGARLISAEAPNEINPLLTTDTPWVMDMENKAVINIQTGETVAIKVVSREYGQGLSPEGGETTVIQRATSIYAYINSKTAQLERLRYENGADITILYTADIVKPEITSDMAAMDSETLQMAMMLIMAIETII